MVKEGKATHCQIHEFASRAEYKFWLAGDGAAIVGVVEGAAETPVTAAVKKALVVDDADAVLVPVVAVASGQAVTVGGTNRTGTVAQCAANEWCTVEMDDDGSVETYRAPQLLKRETMPVPFDPASSGELMLKREAMDRRVAAALDAEGEFRNKGLRRAGVLVVGAGAVALATPVLSAAEVVTALPVRGPSLPTRFNDRTWLGSDSTTAREDDHPDVRVHSGFRGQYYGNVEKLTNDGDVSEALRAKEGEVEDKELEIR